MLLSSGDIVCSRVEYSWEIGVGLTSGGDTISISCKHRNAPLSAHLQGCVQQLLHLLLPTSDKGHCGNSIYQSQMRQGTTAEAAMAAVPTLCFISTGEQQNFELPGRCRHPCSSVANMMSARVSLQWTTS